MAKNRVFAALVLAVLLIVPAAAWAMEITSPFGWREHPITGKRSFHPGVDIAGDYGDAITAAVSGVITDAGWNDGYGLFVVVRDDDGSETDYAHCAEIYVQPGQRVTPGQLLAAVGSTGNSTGPHLHFEYHSTYGSYEADDPMPLLAAAGWDLTYGGAPAVTGDGQFANSDNNDLPYDFGSFYDVAKLVRTVSDQFATVLMAALDVLTGQAMQLLQLLMIIDFAVAAIVWMISKSEFDFDRFFTRKMIGYGFFVWLIANWRDVALSWILKSFVTLGTIGGGSSIAANELSDPSRIIQKGITLLEPLFSYVSSQSGIWALANIHHILLALAIGALIFACFAWIGMQFLFVYLGFYFQAVFALILTPWGSNRFTKFIGEGGIGGLITHGIKIMAMTLVLAIVMANLTDATAQKYDHIVYLRVLFSSAAIAILLHSVAEAMVELFSGQPKL